MAHATYVTEPRGVQAHRGQLSLAAVIVVSVVSVIALFALFSRVQGVPFGFLSKEPAETLAAPRFIGWFAHLVDLVWAAAAASGVLAGWVLMTSGGRARAGLHLAAGGASLVLLFDDLFLLHEAVYPRIGLGEGAVYALYAAGGLLFLWTFLADLRRTDVLVLVVLSGACLASSVLVDLAGTGSRHVLEDGAKALGVTFWAAAVVRAAGHDLRGLIRSAV